MDKLTAVSGRLEKDQILSIQTYGCHIFIGIEKIVLDVNDRILSVVRTAREHFQQAAVSFHHHVVKYYECFAHLFQFCRFRYALPGYCGYSSKTG